MPTIYWEDEIVKLIDQTRLPAELVYVDCRTKEELWQAIKTMQIRGAPAIGVAAAFGVVLGMRQSTAETVEEFQAELAQVVDYLAAARPTAVNLLWALRRMKKVTDNSSAKEPADLKDVLLEEALRILEEDKDICRRIGGSGSALIKQGSSVLTHCNAGGLATADYGTALAVFFRAREEGKDFHVFVDETRPVLQGARLTSWELLQAGINCTLICDNMAASIMRQGRVDMIIVGADRIAANGDTANKIGTYNLACLAQVHKIPLYVAAPSSTFDLTTPTGESIPIEEREPTEVTRIQGINIAPENIRVFNPAFDVTPAAMITAFITENGLIEPPFNKNIKSKTS